MKWARRIAIESATGAFRSVLNLLRFITFRAGDDSAKGIQQGWIGNVRRGFRDSIENVLSSHICFDG